MSGFVLTGYSHAGIYLIPDTLGSAHPFDSVVDVQPLCRLTKRLGASKKGGQTPEHQATQDGGGFLQPTEGTNSASSREIRAVMS